MEVPESLHPPGLCAPRGAFWHGAAAPSLGAGTEPGGQRWRCHQLSLGQELVSPWGTSLDVPHLGASDRSPLL